MCVVRKGRGKGEIWEGNICDKQVGLYSKILTFLDGVSSSMQIMQIKVGF